MGQKLSTVVSESTDKQKEGLKFLRTMIVSKLKSFEHELLNPPSNTHMVRIGTVVDRVEDIHINASTNSDKLSKQINKTLDSLFSGDTAVALKMALSTTVKTFLGRSEAGESTFRDYHIYLQDNALSIINHEEVSRDLLIYEITRFVRNYMKGNALTMNSKLDEQEINEEVTQYLQRLHSIYKLFDHGNNSNDPQISNRLF
ncbi:9025_t:CDS:2 [Paraglomus brasilianum]|uniref:9025_t:CDS:1 n=1 Tax=Paraglomus brasilianum TaxID=144538 RepID=A0A9N9A0Z5_9GLOM|nr:9025_t:CDS:2 [Paraglomus brasilianum]